MRDMRRSRVFGGPGAYAPALMLAAVMLILASVTRAWGAGPGYISTVAGNGQECSVPTAACGDGGPAIVASFSSPRGLTLTPDGGYLIADRFDNRIRKVSSVSPLGVITTWAGTGAACIPKTAACGDGGPASAARLTIPRMTSLTANGGYLIADEGDHRIRQVSALSPAGIITTVAGTGTQCPSPTAACGDNGPATQAMLYFPHAVAALPNGDFLIADTYDHRVRLVSGGIITTVAGTGAYGYSGDGGPATAAQLYYPHGIAPLPGGGFLVADSSNDRIRQVSPSGIITTVAGDGTTCADPTAPVNRCGDNGPATSAQLSLPRTIALVPGGGFIFSDMQTNSIRQVSASGIITTIAGTGVRGFSGDGGPATAAELDWPQDVALRADGSLLIADAAEAKKAGSGPGFGNERIRLVTGQSAAAVFSLNGVTFQPGQHLSYRATLLPAAGQSAVVDVYLGAVLPNGLFASVVSAGSGLTTILGPAPVPFRTSVQLTQMIVVPLTYTFTGQEPEGTYFAYAELVPAGASPFQPLSVDVTAFDFTP